MNEQTQTRRNASPETCALMVYDVPREIKNQFAARCRLNNTTIKEGIILLLTKTAKGQINPFQGV
jgi:hypothetical protein